MKFTFFFLGLLIASHAFTQDEASRFESVFEEVDKNRDGKLSKPELEAAGRRMAWHGRADLDGDGFVDREEIRAFLNRIMPAGSKAGGKIEVVPRSEIPEEAPFTDAGIGAAERYSANHDGHSFLVIFDGEIVRESYANGWDRENGHRLASGTKSFSGALLALAVKDGLLNPDEQVSESITEWREDEVLAAVTYSDLLNLTSGIDPGENGKVPAYEDAAAVGAISGIGVAFRYGPNAFQVFGEAVRRKLKASEDLSFDDPLAYLEARIFQPIGMTYTQWRRDKGGQPHLPSGAFITAPEWGKFGQFLLQKGEWKGEVLLDAEVLERATRPVREVSENYGLTFWLLGSEARDGRPWLEGAYMAAGAGKQRLFVLPAVKTVVVRQGESRRFEDLAFLDALFQLDGEGSSVENGE